MVGILCSKQTLFRSIYPPSQIYAYVAYTLIFDAFWVPVLREQVADGGHKSTHKEFYGGSIFLSYYFYHVPIWDVLEELHVDIPPTVLHMDLPMMIAGDMVQVV